VMGKSYAKGLATALSFSIGVAITLSMYGILAALLGKAVFGFSGGSGEMIKNIFYAMAGIFAIVFALGELGFLKVRMPSYGGAIPGFIQQRKDILKPLLLGLFLGNIGVGCPHPATPMILGQIGVVGDVFYGWLLFFVHAIGRVVPLLFLNNFLIHIYIYFLLKKNFQIIKPPISATPIAPIINVGSIAATSLSPSCAWSAPSSAKLTRGNTKDKAVT